MLSNGFEYKMIKPDRSLSHFVESFWMLANHSDNHKEIVVLPDGRVDLSFTHSATEPFHITLMGIESKPTLTTFPPQTVIFAISLRLPAIEYLLNTGISDLRDGALPLPPDFWEIEAGEIHDFGWFCTKVSTRIKELLAEKTDDRKLKLFDLIYSSNGSLPVKEMSAQVHWSSRQINRYFNRQFGISLKAYCSILRFRASFQHIKEGRLFPEQHFTDQAHFIKEIKKLAGVRPKELLKNANDRFIQFSTLPEK